MNRETRVLCARMGGQQGSWDEPVPHGYCVEDHTEADQGVQDPASGGKVSSRDSTLSTVFEKDYSSLAWRHIPIIPALGKVKIEGSRI